MSMRKYQRAIARAKMKQDGIERINKQFPTYDQNGKQTGKISFFASHWRQYCDMPLEKLMKPRGSTARDIVDFSTGGQWHDGLA